MTITFLHPDGTTEKFEVVPAWTKEEQARFFSLAQAMDDAQYGSPEIRESLPKVTLEDHGE